MTTVFMLLLGFTALFLIMLVLVQRGRGGGLAGALGGMGGSSAFGAKAGDVFTRITVVVATVWIFLCIAAAKLVPTSDSRIDVNATAPAASAPADTDAAAETPASDGDAAETEEPAAE